MRRPLPAIQGKRPTDALTIVLWQSEQLVLAEELWSLHRAHVAIVDRTAAGHLLGGTKRVESRFSQRKRPPFGRVHAGDTVYFKLSGGGLIGSARVTQVRQFQNLVPRDVCQLRREHNGDVRAPARYWNERRHCAYGLLIWITPLSPPPVGMRVPRQYGSAWLVLGAD